VIRIITSRKAAREDDMSEARFTPGPWAVTGQSDAGRYIVVKAANGRTVARVPFSRENLPLSEITDASDAALIAAAPDLYAALEFAVRELRLVRDGSLHGTPNSVFALIPEAIEKADAALSRARGE